MGVLIAVAAGGALGALGRYLLSVAGRNWFGADYSYATFVANLLGSLAIGFLIVWLAERMPQAIELRLFLVVGLLGGFTTFSAFSLEVVLLLQEGLPGRALGYVAVSVTTCLFACWAGMLLARAAA